MRRRVVACAISAAIGAFLTTPSTTSASAQTCRALEIMTSQCVWFALDALKIDPAASKQAETDATSTLVAGCSQGEYQMALLRGRPLADRAVRNFARAQSQTPPRCAGNAPHKRAAQALAHVARMERSNIRERIAYHRLPPHCAALNAGYRGFTPLPYPFRPLARSAFIQSASVRVDLAGLLLGSLAPAFFFAVGLAGAAGAAASCAKRSSLKRAVLARTAAASAS